MHIFVTSGLVAIPARRTTIYPQSTLISVIDVMINGGIMNCPSVSFFRLIITQVTILSLMFLLHVNKK